MLNLKGAQHVIWGPYLRWTDWPGTSAERLLQNLPKQGRGENYSPSIGCISTKGKRCNRRQPKHLLIQTQN